ncbi:MAG TPA: aminotransferase class V-fold PLP-dependent enzyme [Thermoanaerobaculia bacterium]|nr:aminotransferase class V-fold PLP-dependent enzyme [Thermoanaerobaculia bacterium]
MATWRLDPEIDYLNHGSYGACPAEVLGQQQRWRDELEREPMRFFGEVYQPALDDARNELATFVGADPAGLVFVPNATTGANAVLRSMERALLPGDELLTTSHAYNACRNALEATAARAGARVVVASVPFPLEDPSEVAAAVLGSVTDRTRLALLDHVTSPTAVRFPIEALVATLEPRVPVLVDGAHAPGMVPLGLDALGASFYVGNCHKWLCAPKGAGFLHVREDYRERVLPVTISHGWNGGWGGDNRLHALFDWTGTTDPTPALCVPAALQTIGALDPRGWPGVMEANRDLALQARDILAGALGVEAPAPDDMLGAMATLPLPDSSRRVTDRSLDALSALLRERGFTVPVFVWPAWPSRVLRVSAQRYNLLDQYQRLAVTLRELLDGGG